MPQRSLPRLLSVALFALSFAAQAQTYRWVDKEGRVHYTDTPPPATAVKSEEKSLKGNTASAGDLPYATQVAMKNFPVKLYTEEGCAPCDSGRSLLNKRGIPFKEISVKAEATHAELKKVNPDETVPTLVVGNEVSKNFVADAWNKSLDLAGYPKTGVANAQKTEPAQPQVKKEDTPRGPYSPQ